MNELKDKANKFKVCLDNTITCEDYVEKFIRNNSILAIRFTYNSEDAYIYIKSDCLLIESVTSKELIQIIKHCAGFIDYMQKEN